MKKVYEILSWTFVISGIIGGLYVGGYLMFVKPILDCLIAFDSNTLTVSMFGFTILKCLFSSIIGFSIAGVGYFFGMVFAYLKQSI